MWKYVKKTREKNSWKHCRLIISVTFNTGHFDIGRSISHFQIFIERYQKFWRKWVNKWQDPIQSRRLVLIARQKLSPQPDQARVLFNASLLLASVFLFPVAFAFLSAWTIGKMFCILAPTAITPSESTKNEQYRRTS